MRARDHEFVLNRGVRGSFSIDKLSLTAARFVPVLARHDMNIVQGLSPDEAGKNQIRQTESQPAFVLLLQKNVLACFRKV